MTHQQRVVFVSRARQGLSFTDIQAILGNATVHNRRCDVTGMLSFTGSHFMEIMEGPDEAVTALLLAVDKDERHSGLRLVDQHAIEHRSFTGWQLLGVDRLDLADAVQALYESPAPTQAAIEALLHRLLYEQEFCGLLRA